MQLLSKTTRAQVVSTRRVCPRPVIQVVTARPPLPGAARPCLAAAAAAAAAEPVKEAAHWDLTLKELDAKPTTKKVLVASIAPAVRVAISEAFNLPPGAIKVGQIVTALKQLGFDHVFDTLFAADLTIMEEGTELLHRLQAHLEGHPDTKEPMPMFTSCCPGWVGMVEKMYPELIPYLSTCKSPQMMMGAIIKHFFAEENNTDPNSIVSVSIMPCVRKQGEAERPTNETFGHEHAHAHAEACDVQASVAAQTATGQHIRDVDHVITTVELAKILQERGIDLPNLPETPFDDPLGTGSGGAQLFGTTGGVMEAALRTVYEVVTGKPLERLNYDEVRGLENIRETSVVLKPAADSPFAKFDKGEGLTLRVAVANGLGSAKKLITMMKSGEAKYDFVEVMACPSGCIGGGGQPRSSDKQILPKRQAAMYSLDDRAKLRRSHENPFVQKLYEKWLGAPNSHTAHELLHTTYVPGGVDGDK